MPFIFYSSLLKISSCDWPNESWSGSEESLHQLKRLGGIARKSPLSLHPDGNQKIAPKPPLAAAAATEAMVNSSLGESGSIIGSLAQMNSRNSGQEGGQSKEKQSEGNFPPNDPSGDKTVSEMLKKSRDPQS